ncbi:MAG: hypothetical protein L0Y36_04130 [Planctomycetales bacterium]|nr:hypothetical protein [Planctomycetales bacterium]
MNKLTQEQQQLILDFYFRCGEQDDIERGRDLIASNHEASRLYANLEMSLTDLDHIKYEPCPDNLADLTIARLKLAAKCTTSSNSRLHQLLEQQREVPLPSAQSARAISHPKKNFFRPAFEILATAASITLIAGILFPSFVSLRRHAQQNTCAYNQGQISKAFSSLASNDGALASTRVQAGSPWWKIGDQGSETQSNTRYPFHLVKQGYIDGRMFVCPGDKQAKCLTDTPAHLGQLNDFPSRSNISYSFILWHDKNSNPFTGSRRIIAGDLNPVFRKILFQQNTYRQRDEFEQVLLDEELKKILSDNHRCRGQNILYSDGSIEFTKSRIINGDDIFTIHGVDIYIGREIPASVLDTFLTP